MEPAVYDTIRYQGRGESPRNAETASAFRPRTLNGVGQHTAQRCNVTGWDVCVCNYKLKNFTVVIELLFISPLHHILLYCPSSSSSSSSFFLSTQPTQPTVYSLVYFHEPHLLPALLPDSELFLILSAKRTLVQFNTTPLAYILILFLYP